MIELANLFVFFIDSLDCHFFSSQNCRRLAVTLVSPTSSYFRSLFSVMQISLVGLFRTKAIVLTQSGWQACESSSRIASSSSSSFLLKRIKLAFIGIHSFGFSFCPFKDVINNLRPAFIHRHQPRLEIYHRTIKNCYLRNAKNTSIPLTTSPILVL